MTAIGKDVERVLQEAREAVEAMGCLCLTEDEMGIADGSDTVIGETCRRCRVLAGFNADMPAAIGWLVEHGANIPHKLECLRGKATGESPECTCGGEAALAKLEKREDG